MRGVQFMTFQGLPIKRLMIDNRVMWPDPWWDTWLDEGIGKWNECGIDKWSDAFAETWDAYVDQKKGT
jgi:hypothetical protein